MGNCEERKASAAVAAESQAELARKVAESANEVAALRQELATAEAGHCNMQDAARYRAFLVHEPQSHPDLLEGSKQISVSCILALWLENIFCRDFSRVPDAALWRMP